MERNIIKMSIKIIDLGLIDYKEAWNLQLELIEKRYRKNISDVLILAQHPDVITLGRRGKIEEIKSKQFPVYNIERGGKSTYHGPGQIIGYPIIDLNEKNITVTQLVENLEEVIIRTLEKFNINSNTIKGKPGVWVDNKKISSIGLAVRKCVSYHGFALNVDVDLTKFNSLNPCGMDSNIMTSMERLYSKEISHEEVKKHLIENFKEIFDYKIIDYENLISSHNLQY